ncbi:MAG: anthranilate phosphoribosyltransferase [Ferrimicrobium sp.]
MLKRSWSDLLSRLLGGATLSEAEAAEILGAILDGGVDPVVIAATLIALRARGETVDELVGFALAMREHMVEVVVQGVIADTCGTGGDRHGTINVSTAAALVVTAAGVKVCKHGGRAASSASGSADVLEELGVAIDSQPATVARCIDEVGIGFAFAPRYHPAMAVVAPVRRALGVPTAFNFLGPLVNPARATVQLVGVFDPDLCQPMAEVLLRLGSTHALVVHGAQGLDELSVSGPSSVIEVQRDGAGEVEFRQFLLAPEDVGVQRAPLSEIRGGTPSENARLMVEVLSGQRRDSRLEVVVLNAGAAIYVAGQAASIADGVEIARDLIETGAPMEVLQRFRDVSNAT